MSRNDPTGDASLDRIARVGAGDALARNRTSGEIRYAPG
jgi:hypothetical protein